MEIEFIMGIICGFMLGYIIAFLYLFLKLHKEQLALELETLKQDIKSYQRKLDDFFTSSSLK